MTEIDDFGGFEDLLEHDWTGVVEEMEKAEAVVLEVNALLTEMIEQVQMRIAEAEMRVVPTPQVVSIARELFQPHVIDLTGEEVKVVGQKRVYELIDLTEDD